VRRNELATSRLRLYAPRLEDLEVRLAMERDPKVMRFIRPVPDDEAAHRAELRTELDGPPGRAAFWHVEECAISKFIGWCGLFSLENSGLIEIGYRFVQAAWGRGLASEAAAAVLNHGFRTFGLDPIVAVSHPDNAAVAQGAAQDRATRPRPRATLRSRFVVLRIEPSAYLAGA